MEHRCLETVIFCSFILNRFFFYYYQFNSDFKIWTVFVKTFRLFLITNHPATCFSNALIFFFHRFLPTLPTSSFHFPIKFICNKFISILWWDKSWSNTYIFLLRIILFLKQIIWLQNYQNLVTWQDNHFI